MDSKKFAEKQIRVGGTTGVEPISIKYIDKNYELKTYSKNITSKTGHLKIAELFSSDGKLPKFEFRWDHNKSIMDIDMFPKENEKLWEKEKDGYKGHHLELTDDEKREYSVRIEIPKRKIFVGIIMVGLLVDLNSYDNLLISEDIKIKIE